MKSVGYFLKEARLAKGATVEEASMETNISTLYLEALENDDFTVFYGETYLLGFIKTYADFLGADAPRAIALYENYKKGEEPAPMHALMMKEPIKINFKLIVPLTLAGVIIILGVIFGPELHKRHQLNLLKEAKAALASKNHSYAMEDDSLEKDFRAGDQVVVKEGVVTHVFIVSKIANTSIDMTWDDGEGEEKKFTVDLGDEKFLSLTGTDRANFVVKPIDIGLENGAAARINFRRISSGAKSPSALVELPSVAAAVNPVAAPRDNKTRTVLMSLRSPMRIDVLLTFKGYCFFRYRLDDREVAERYYQDGEQIRRDLNSNMTMWASNAGKTRLKVGPNEIQLGRDGEPTVKRLRWIFNISARVYELILEDVA